jgi:hypothetical protein
MTDFTSQPYCSSIRESKQASTTYSYSTLASQSKKYGVEVGIEAEVELGVEGAKVTVPVKVGMSYSNSKETTEERNMAADGFTSSTSRVAYARLYMLQRSSTKTLTNEDFEENALERINRFNNLQYASKEARFEEAQRFINAYGTHYYT